MSLKAHGAFSRLTVDICNSVSTRAAHEGSIRSRRVRISPSSTCAAILMVPALINVSMTR